MQNLEASEEEFWLDMGSFNDLNDCSNFIKTIETRQNFMIGSPEEIAWRNKWISKESLKELQKNIKTAMEII